jgi:hypothetical protein
MAGRPVYYTLAGIYDDSASFAFIMPSPKAFGQWNLEGKKMPKKKATTVTLPVLALRGMMVFPHMVLHFDVGRAKSVASLEQP